VCVFRGRRYAGVAGAAGRRGRLGAEDRGRTVDLAEVCERDLCKPRSAMRARMSDSWPDEALRLAAPRRSLGGERGEGAARKLTVKSILPPRSYLYGAMMRRCARCGGSAWVAQLTATYSERSSWRAVAGGRLAVCWSGRL